jgi:hypothetical protein
MKMPWHGKSGLAKATAFLATLLGVSLGLCGVNFVAVMSAVSWGGSSSMAASVLTFTGIVELAGIAVGIVGLVIVAIIAIVRTFLPRSEAPSDQEKSE